MKLAAAMRPSMYFNYHGKIAMHREGRRVLRALAKELGLEKHEFEVRSNEAGPAVSGEIILHSNHWYIQVFKSGDESKVLWRLCNGRKDCSGLRNHYAIVENLEDDVKGFALMLREALSCPFSRSGGPADPGKSFQISDAQFKRFAIESAAA
jgi:hypothetical protein